MARQSDATRGLKAVVMVVVVVVMVMVRVVVMAMVTVIFSGEEAG